MNKRVYYGEYSLKHWLELILKENIVLPWYQRSFVWKKPDIENLIKTLDNNQFIPPIIIGAVKKNDEWKNYILDGQQRLTSILFASLNKFIDTKEYLTQKPEAEIIGSADDISDREDEVDDDERKMINWNFSEIIKEKQLDEVELNRIFYKQLLVSKKEEKWFEEHFLGFAYIKPDNNVNEEAQSKFYTDIFRNINIGGIKLTRSENRKALYFLKEELKNYFVPDFLSNIVVATSSKESGLLDFIKYLSILSQYKGNNTILKKYGGRDWDKNENYYQSYIMSVVESNTANDLNFDMSYPTIPFNSERIDKLKIAIAQLEIPK